MKTLNKKIFLSLGAVAAITTPVVITISCADLEVNTKDVVTDPDRLFDTRDSLVTLVDNMAQNVLEWKEVKPMTIKITNITGESKEFTFDGIDDSLIKDEMIAFYFKGLKSEQLLIFSPEQLNSLPVTTPGLQGLVTDYGFTRDQLLAVGYPEADVNAVLPVTP